MGLRPPMAYTMDCPAALVTVAVATPVQLVGILARTSQLLLATASSGAVGSGSTVRDGSVVVSSVHAVSPNAPSARMPSTRERLLIGSSQVGRHAPHSPVNADITACRMIPCREDTDWRVREPCVGREEVFRNPSPCPCPTFQESRAWMRSGFPAVKRRATEANPRKAINPDEERPNCCQQLLRCEGLGQLLETRHGVAALRAEPALARAHVAGPRRGVRGTRRT